MKFFAASIFIIVLASVTSLVMGQDVAIVVLINGGQAIGDGSCSSDENIAIQAALNSAVADASKQKLRHLRTSRQLAPSFCTKLCAGYAPGWCHVAYPSCVNMRMLLENANDGSSTIKVKQDVPFVDSGRKDAEKDATLVKQCSKAVDSVEKAIKQELLWGNLAPTCKDLLREKTVLNCMEVPPP